MRGKNLTPIQLDAVQPSADLTDSSGWIGEDYSLMGGFKRDTVEYSQKIPFLRQSFAKKHEAVP